MADFRSRIAKVYQNKVIKPLEKRVRAVAIKLDEELALTTPVKTGRARANWLPSLNTPETRTVEPNQKPGITPVLAAYKIDDTVLISNNLPYIQRLNDGSSKQAPAGFVESAIARAKRIVRK